MSVRCGQGWLSMTCVDERRPGRRVAAVLMGLAMLLIAPAAAPATTADAANSAPSFVVDGAVERPASLTVDDLRTDFPQRSVRVVFLRGEERQRHSYRGPLLHDVLNAAEPSFQADAHHDALVHSILVTATDGFHTAVAWGEIDPDLAATEVLLAYEEDGTPLERPRLVVPGDRTGARYVADVAAVTLVRVGGG